MNWIIEPNCTIGCAIRIGIDLHAGPAIVVVSYRNYDENGAECTEAKGDSGYHPQIGCGHLEIPKRQFEWNSRLTAAAFSIAVPLLLTLCFAFVFKADRARSRRSRLLAICGCVLSLLATCFLINASVR